MAYLWQYYLLIGIIVLQGIILCFGSKQGKNIFLWLCFWELVFISGFRAWNIGNDTLNYVGTFVATANHLDLYSHMEKGFLLYNRILSCFTSNPQAILLVSAVVIIGSIFRFIKKYSAVMLLPVLLFVVLQFGGTMNVIREYLAVAIVLFSLPFIVKRRFVSFAIGCLVASTFHTSAILALSLYFLYDFPFQLKYLLLVLVGTVFVFVFLSPVLDQIIDVVGRYETYKGNRLLGEETKVASIFKSLIQVAIFSFCYFSYKYVYRFPQMQNSFLPVQFLLWTSVIATCLQIISIRGTVLERLVTYFSIFNLVSIPFFVHCYPQKMRTLVAVGLVGCFVLYQSIIFVYRPDWNYVLPFKFCF